MDILLQHIWLVPVVFFTAILTAVSGAGGGVLLLGLMGTVLPPLSVVPLHGAVMAPQNLWRGWLLRKFIDWPYVLVVMAGSVVGAAIAAPVATSLPENALRVVLGVGILYLVWAPKLKGELKIPFVGPRGKLWIMAVFVSIITMVIGAAGVLFNIIRRRSGIDKKAVLADQSAIMLVQHLLKMLAYGLYGFVFGPYIALVVAMACMGLVGTYVGVTLLNKMSNVWFDHIFKLVVTVLGGKLLIDAGFVAF